MVEARSRIVTGQITFDSMGAPSTCGIRAVEQTAGHGQRGRVWHATRGESLTVTYYIRHSFALPQQAGRVPIMAGVAASGVLRSLLNLDVRLKWPNDMIIGDKKVGGILVEMVRDSSGLSAALVGIGVNVFQKDFPQDISRSATSLVIEAGSSLETLIPSVEDLAQAIGTELDSFARVQSGTAFSQWIETWRELDGYRGRQYVTRHDGGRVIGTAVGIDGDGALLLQLNDTSVITVSSASSLQDVDI